MIDTDWSPHASHCCSGTPAITVALSWPQPHTTLCTVTGAVNWNTTPLVRDALTEARRDDNVHLVIDLSRHPRTADRCAQGSLRLPRQPSRCPPRLRRRWYQQRSLAQPGRAIHSTCSPLSERGSRSIPVSGKRYNGGRGRCT
jgi:hypothetical protein